MDKKNKQYFIDYYQKNKESLDEYRMDYYYKNKEHMDKQANEYRKRTRSPALTDDCPAYCYKCDTVKPQNLFFRLNEEKTRGKCKECRSEEAASYYLENKETVKAFAKEYYQKNKEKIRARQRELSALKKKENERK